MGCRLKSLCSAFKCAMRYFLHVFRFGTAVIWLQFRSVHAGKLVMGRTKLIVFSFLLWRLGMVGDFGWGIAKFSLSVLNRARFPIFRELILEAPPTIGGSTWGALLWALLAEADVIFVFFMLLIFWAIQLGIAFSKFIGNGPCAIRFSAAFVESPRRVLLHIGEGPGGINLSMLFSGVVSLFLFLDPDVEAYKQCH